MRFYALLDRVFPRSYTAKFLAVLLPAAALPVLAAVLVPPVTAAGMTILLSAILAAGIGAERAMTALLAPLARISDSLQRMEAGYRARPLPERHRDEIGLLMDCANKLAARFVEEAARPVRETERDGLTGLLNRQGFEDRVSTLRSGAILVIGLGDRESLGTAHDDGRLPVAIAGRLTETLRSGDLLARAGDDEFLAFLPGASLDEARQAAERVRLSLEAEAMPDGSSLDVSIGVAGGGRGVGGRKMLEAADRAAFLARSGGRNRVVCAKALPASGIPARG